ncbi:MAG: hypothetical protein IJW36_03720 [Clostridia bacterium]|nr:hypothetical protein [Clostridia bacterium]
MYNKKKIIDGLNAVLDAIPNNISPEGLAKKEKIKADLKKIKDKNNSSQAAKNDPQEPIKIEDSGIEQVYHG